MVKDKKKVVKKGKKDVVKISKEEAQRRLEFSQS